MEKEQWTERMSEYQAKSRISHLKEQKLLFWKHVIITAFICFTLCYLAYQANDYFSEHITLEAETNAQGDITLINSLIGAQNGEIKN